MKMNFISGFLAGAIVFGSITAFAAGLIAEPNTFPVQVNGQNVNVEGYNVNNYTYFKLRDIADAVGGFEVGFSNNTIQLSKNGYVYNNAVAEEVGGVSWEEISGGSFSCGDCGGDIFIGTTTDDMKPYIEGTGNNGSTSIYGALEVISDSKLHYSDAAGGFDIIIKDVNTIEIKNDTLGGFAGIYQKYNWVLAG